eukprot:6172115-Pleurochrysis_carterae.AAC.1
MLLGRFASVGTISSGKTHATAFCRFVRKLDCKCDKCSQPAHVRSGVLLRRLLTCECENEFDLDRRPCVSNK